MKKSMKFISAALAAMLCTGLLASCSSSGSVSSSSSSSAASSSAASSSSVSSTEPAQETYDYSAGLEENGFFAGINALDHVTLPEDYTAISLPADVTDVTEQAVQTEIDSMLASFAEPEQITDRAIEDGDKVNIDYSGSVDGEKFSGGTASSQSVTAGSEEFIDDFLTQIIGHKAGETFDVEVTFPDPYQNNPDLAGKDAVFEVTVNYIEGEDITPEFTDAFVQENLTATYGWADTAAVRQGIEDTLRQNQRFEYVWQYVMDNSSFNEVPDAVFDFHKNAIINNIKQQGAQYGLDYETTLTQLLGVESEEAMLEQMAENLQNTARQALVIQAVAEAQDMSVSTDDLKQYFSANMGSEDYSMFEEYYGLPFLNWTVLGELVSTYLTENAVEA